MKNDAKTLRLTVKLSLREESDLSPPASVAYAFDQHGRFLTAATFAAGCDGEVTLEVPGALAGRHVRLLVGPAQRPTEDKQHQWQRAVLGNAGLLPSESPGIETLKRMGSLERTVRLAQRDTLVHLDVYPVDWQRWLTCTCVVRGRLVKQVPMPDGTVQDWGVCHACILVDEVDTFSYVVARLPDMDIYRIREELLREWPRQPEIPWPPQDPPRPPVPPGPTPPSGPDAAEAPHATGATANVGHLSIMEDVTLAASASQLRQVFMDYADIMVRYLCAWPWFMSWFSRDLVAIACTDEQGYFETTVSYPCLGDHPDLYFRAVQWNGGSLNWLYDPGLRCHTHWNYECGTDLTLVTNDPSARVCAPPEAVDPPPGVNTWVLINRVGGLLIDGIGADGLVGYDFVESSGTVTMTGAPFGGTIGLRVSHSSDIPDAGLRYYRWLFNKDGDVDGMGDPIWTEFAMPMAPSVGRHYADFDESNPAQPPTFPVYTLGPKSVAGLTMYDFRPQPAELQALAPPNHTYQWPIEAVGNDIYSGRLTTTGLPGGIAGAHGLYWFKLEIYDDAGSLVTPGASTFRFIVMTTAAGDTRLPVSGEVQDGGFVFPLHLDNRHCEAVIDAPAIATVGADPNCGFLRFETGDTVTLDFHARQPHTSFGAVPTDYATFAFWIRRGAGVIHSVGGEVAAGTAGAWSGDNHGNFHADFTPGSLVGPCKQAAFAEVLRVYAKATNGWRRLREYDAGTEWAFALTPGGPGTGSGS